MPHYTGFRGQLSDIGYVKEASLPHAAKLDLVEMAKKSLHYLMNNPMPEHAYQCRFTLAPSFLPPFCPEQQIPSIGDFIDPITEGDTESRNDVAFSMMREMIGDYDSGSIPEEKVHERLLSYLQGEGFGHGLFRNHGYSICIVNDSTYINLWPTGMLLHSECLRVKHGLCDASVARAIFEGMMDEATREDGRAYFRHGFAIYNETEAPGTYADHYPVVMSGLCEYWMLTGDERCLEFLYELAEGLVCDLQPQHLHREDGGLDGHNHTSLHSVRGMAQFAYLTGEVRYLKWVKDIYDYYCRWSLDTGWLPEIRDLHDHSNHSETCLNADMLEVELWLALAGYDELWDQVERDLRNYFGLMQFEVTSGYETWYREVHKDAPACEVEAAIDYMRELEGGFISAATPNDYIFKLREGGAHFGAVDYRGGRVSFDMMGCCPPEGMRAIYFAWKYAQQTEDDTTTVYLPIDSESDEAKVESSLPCRGHLRITAKKGGSMLVRIPKWAPRSEVSVSVNGSKIPVIWSGCAKQYVEITGLLPCDAVEVDYLLLDMIQTVSITPFEQPAQTYRYHWIGNTVAGVDPEGEFLPLYPKL